MAKKQTKVVLCATCNRNPQATVQGAPVVGRAGTRHCVSCAELFAKSYAPLKLSLVGSDDTDCAVVFIEGQCPWCPVGERHAHLVSAVEFVDVAQLALDSDGMRIGDRIRTVKFNAN